MLKVVLDTNIFVSSLLSKAGSPAMVINAWRAGSYLLVASPSIISEIKRVVEAPSMGIEEKKFHGQKDSAPLCPLPAPPAPCNFEEPIAQG